MGDVSPTSLRILRGMYSHRTATHTVPFLGSAKKRRPERMTERHTARLPGAAITQTTAPARSTPRSPVPRAVPRAVNFASIADSEAEVGLCDTASNDLRAETGAEELDDSNSATADLLALSILNKEEEELQTLNLPETIPTSDPISEYKYISGFRSLSRTQYSSSLTPPTNETNPNMSKNEHCQPVPTVSAFSTPTRSHATHSTVHSDCSPSVLSVSSLSSAGSSSSNSSSYEKWQATPPLLSFYKTLSKSPNSHQSVMDNTPEPSQPNR